MIRFLFLLLMLSWVIGPVSPKVPWTDALEERLDKLVEEKSLEIDWEAPRLGLILSRNQIKCVLWAHAIYELDPKDMEQYILRYRYKSVFLKNCVYARAGDYK